MKHLSAKKLFILILIFFTKSLLAQDTEPKKYTASNKGKFKVSWGGNRAVYSDSDITFKGDDYNFTLKEVKSHDKPKGWHIDYINPSRLTIPQTNYKIGYYISDHYIVSVGVDHMKYIATQNQFTTIRGDIDLPLTQEGSQFNGIYINAPIQLTEDFLKFEHTDGLNYIYSEIARSDDISSLFKISNTDVFQVNLIEGIGVGALLPKTNATLLSKERHDEFNLAGYGVNVTATLNLTFYKHFFIQGNLKGGYINMSTIRTTNDSADSASQSFFYLQRVVSFGGIFRL
tara:strand:- start:442288 stop:443148 length:861 start_codon:yes stop_codon:yes gene_type:complete